MVKAIFFDIDGTLVSFTNDKIPQSTLKALAELKEKGIKLFVASGRPRCNLKIIEDLGLFDGYITMNGQYCIIGDEVVCSTAIDPADLRSIYDYIIEKDIICHVIELDRVYVNKNDKRLDALDGLVGVFLRSIPEGPFEEILEKTIYQLAPFITKAEEVEFLKHTPNCKAARWHDMFTDIIPASGGKNVGIDVVLEKLGIDISETMAFGDGGNDISMLQHVAIGIAMGNAKPEVKSASHYVTTHIDDNGIHNALKHFKLL